MREFEFIEGLASRFPRLEGVKLGIGDDAAILEKGAFDLVALDTMVEGVHFRTDLSSAFDIGWKLLASNLSDIAAMGGEAGPYLLGLSLGSGVDAAFLSGMVDGLEAAAAELAPGCPVAPIGGDTTRSPGPTVLTLTLFGRSDLERGPVTRGGAEEGDLLVVVGCLGDAAAGLETLTRRIEGDEWERLRSAHRRPRAASTLGACLARLGHAKAMIDVSDGFAQDLGHILRSSGVGARISVEDLPSSPQARRLAQALGMDADDWVLSGGDDYALVVALAPEDREAVLSLAAPHSMQVSLVGHCVAAQEGLILVDAAGVERDWSRAGYEHTFGRRG